MVALNRCLQAHIQAKGLTGGLATWKGGGISQSKYMPSSNTGGGEQGGEYYINGMYPLTCQIDVPELREIREQSIAKILKDVGPNGTIGGDVPYGKFDKKINYWGSARYSEVTSWPSRCLVLPL